MVEIELDWDGFYAEKSLPIEKYEQGCVYSVHSGKKGSEGLKFKKLLYIGKSKNGSNCPSDPNHNARQCWLSSLEEGETLWVAFANEDDEARAETALIYKLKPVCNKSGVDSFNYEETKVINNGKRGFISELVTAK